LEIDRANGELMHGRNSHQADVMRILASVLFLAEVAMRRALILTVLGSCATTAAAPADEPAPLCVATFQADVTPPLGTPLCDGLVPPAEKIVDPLSARGLVLLVERPIVLCAIDWVGIGNTGHDAWREALAEAAGTDADRVAVHCLHQHDAPGCDFLADSLAAEYGLGDHEFNVAFAREAITRTADAVRESVSRPQAVTHVGLGRGRGEMVASNRRLLGDDGRVQFVRFSSCQDEAVRALPEGTIDPDVRLVSFWEGERPVAALTYYATHPQSYYGQGGVSADFVGMARALREQDLPAAAHVHFNGAGGNVAAGKYNDGLPENRPLLAQRLAAGMRRAWDSQEKFAVAASDVEWRVQPVALPLSPLYEDESALVARLADESLPPVERLRAVRALAFARRVHAGHQVPLACLRLGSAYVLHMPGELFVEYQLAAQALRPDDFVAMAAYGDYGCGYIGTEIAYTQGGYETGPVSRVAPSVEAVLLDGLRELLR
jgi:hypothetical protein